MRMKIFASVPLALAAATTGFGEQLLPPIEGPLPALLFDAPARAFRPIMGIPGFASLGPVIGSGIYDFGSASPAGLYGIASRTDRWFLISRSGITGSWSEFALEGEQLLRPDGAAWATDGSQVAVFSRADNWVRIISGLPDSPRLGPLVRASTLAEGTRLTGVAVSGRGETAVTISGSNNGGVFLVDAAGTATRLFDMEAPALVAFGVEPKDEKLLVWDQTSERVRIFRLAERFWDSTTLDPVMPGLVAINVSRDRHGREAVLAAAAGADPTLWIFDIGGSGGEPPARLALGFQPDRIDAIGRDAFLLAARAREGESSWSVSVYPETRICFIPAGTPNAPGASLK